MPEPSPDTIEVILGNASSRFSGVTSTMLQVLDVQRRSAGIAVLGRHFVPEGVTVLSFWQVAQLCRRPLPGGRWRVFHARRNDEMIQGVILRYLLGAKLKLVFTSTAQRRKTWITRWLMRRMDGLLSTCVAAARYMPYPPDRLIPHGVDPAVYTPAENRDELWRRLGLPGSYGIGIFGRVRYQKGVDLLIDAVIPLLADNPDLTLVVVGEVVSDQQSFLETQQHELEQAGVRDQVVFTGELPFAALPAYFQVMSVVVAASRNEGFGLTVLEAMASGAAVVASEAGAWPDIISDGQDGFLVPTGDSGALRQRLERLVRDPTLRQEFGARARQKVCETYTVEREAHSLLEYYRSVSAKP